MVKKNDISYKYYAPKDTDQAGLLSTIDDAVDNGAKVVVTPGFNFSGALYQAQEKYPDVKFVTIDFEPQKDGSGETKVGDNTVSYLFSEQESGYVAGYAAVKEGYTKLGFMGGMALPAVENYGVGYLQGASDAAKEMNVNVDVNYTYTVHSLNHQISNLKLHHGTQVELKSSSHVVDKFVTQFSLLDKKLVNTLLV